MVCLTEMFVIVGSVILRFHCSIIVRNFYYSITLQCSVMTPETNIMDLSICVPPGRDGVGIEWGFAVI